MGLITNIAKYKISEFVDIAIETLQKWKTEKDWKRTTSMSMGQYFISFLCIKNGQAEIEKFKMPFYSSIKIKCLGINLSKNM